MSASAKSQAPPAKRRTNTISRFTLIPIIIIFLGTALLFASSSRRLRDNPNGSSVTASPRKTGKNNIAKSVAKVKGASSVLSASSLSPLLAPLPADPLPETITTYAEDCVTPKNAFNLGDTVCAKLSGGPPLSIVPRKFNWVSPNDFVQSSTLVANDPDTNSFTLPGAGSGEYRGVWRINSISASRASVRTSAFFTVSDPANASADLLMYDSNSSDGSAGTGSTIAFVLWMTNHGPDAATNVHVTDAVPIGATFVSVTQNAGPTFTCTDPGANSTSGTIDCTIGSLGSGESARFTVVYTINGAVGTQVSNTASISSNTNDLNSNNNSETSTLDVVAGAAETFCSLQCPADMIVIADTTQGGQPGAIVTFGSAEAAGDCGTLVASPTSGSFFPVGTTPVTISGNGGACTFNVTVTDAPAPTISCPDPVTKDAGTECSTTLSAAELGTPSTTGTDVTVDADRNDGLGLDSPYPIGTTTITWTATDTYNRKVSCTQVVTITGSDNIAPTITAPPNITDATGAAGAACGKIIGESELGTPTTSDNCTGTITITRTGVPAGNFFPVGTTTITYTATDRSGNVSQPVTQTVTITENTPPIILAPPDATYTCVSDVPAADPSQAHGDNPNLPNGGPVTDNCGVPVVTVNETRTGQGNPTSPLIITRVFTATDASNNSASATQTITVIDSTPPTISCPTDIVVYLPLNSTAVTVPVNFNVTASDNCAGVTVVSTPASGSAFPVGTTTVNSTATDAGGNTASCSFNVTVRYNFTGFFSPVLNPPTFNVVNAGRAIPVKFSLSGNKGLNIFAANSPQSGLMACDASAPATDLTDTVTAGGSSLSYDASTDQYNYVWKTDSSWAGTCRQLVVTLKDGTQHVANFKFK